MPASQLYRQFVENPTRNIISRRDVSTRDNPFGRSRLHVLPQRQLLTLDIRTTGQQFELDAAMWYGAIKTGPWKMLLTKIFHIFYHAGVMYTIKGGWKDWSTNKDGNVASLLSHGQRVLVQIPSVENGGAALWKWLNEPDQIPTRSAATHGQSRITPEVLMKGHHQYVKEKKGWMQAPSGFFLGRHFGVNVALGGRGNRNPFSATNNDEAFSYRPIQADGRDGHVYINYMAPEQGKVGGLLIGCENAEHGKGGNPHTGATHSLTGESQKISACGGKKWSDMTVGPWTEYNGLICDLVNTRYENLDWLTGTGLFDPDRLDGPTNEVPDATGKVVGAQDAGRRRAVPA